MHTRFLRVLAYLVLLIAAMFALAYARRAEVSKVRAEHLYCQWFHDQWHEFEFLKNTAPRRVAFIGDSSTMDLLPHESHQEYATIVRGHLADLQTAFWPIRAYGNAIDTEYLLADQMIVRRPDAAVLIVNLQAFSDRFGFFRHPDRAAWIALSTIPEALWLPLEESGVAASDLLVMPFVRMLRLCEAGDAAGAYREVFRARLGFRPAETAPPAARMEDRYPEHLSEDYWGVEVFRAFVRKFQRANIPLLIVIEPVHVIGLRETGAYERMGIAGSLDLLKGIAREHGAEILDLSELLTEEQFRDTATHFTVEGTVLVANETGKGLREFLLRRVFKKDSQT